MKNREGGWPAHDVCSMADGSFTTLTLWQMIKWGKGQWIRDKQCRACITRPLTWCAAHALRFYRQGKIALVTSSIVIGKRELPGSMGFLPSRPNEEDMTLNFETLTQIFNGTSGLSSDKIKAVLEVVWKAVDACGFKGVVFAYDEAQNMSDHAAKEQYPLSTMLDVFQSIQKKGIRFMLCLVGLPTLFPKLVDSKTRRFWQKFLKRSFMN